VAVTASPDWVTPAFHSLVIFWSPAKVKVRLHEVSAVVPVLVRVRFATNPPAHWLEVV
jgi:hypothetical protein